MELWVFGALAAVGGVLACLRPGTISHDSVKRRPTTLPPPAMDPGGSVHLYLTNIAADANRIQVIKVIRQYTPMGLKEAKDKVDNVPILLAQNLSEAGAARFEQDLATVGAITSRQAAPQPAADASEEDYVDVELTVVGESPIRVIK